MADRGWAPQVTAAPLGWRSPGTSRRRGHPLWRGQVALNRRGDGGDYLISRQRGQRLDAQDVPTQSQAEQLRRDERAALGRLLIARGGDRPRDQLAEYVLKLPGDGLAGDGGPQQDYQLVVADGTLHVIYADHELIDSDLTGFARTEMEDTRDEKAAGVAEAAAQIAAAAGVPYTFERRQDSPADAILSAAGIHDAAEPASTPVIVTGRSHHAAHHIIGSVPVELLHQSPYPVLTIT
jgi:nucleotide-binding universal stress UspA family protein